MVPDFGTMNGSSSVQKKEDEEEEKRLTADY